MVSVRKGACGVPCFLFLLTIISSRTGPAQLPRPTVRRLSLTPSLRRNPAIPFARSLMLRGGSEGESSIMHEGSATFDVRNGTVFYNNVMIVNRDLSVLVMKYFVSTCLEERRASWRRRCLREYLNSELSDNSTKVESTENATAGNSNMPMEVEQGENQTSANEVVEAAQNQSVSKMEVEVPDEVLEEHGYNLSNFSREMVVLDAMSASGLRAIRYSKEVSNVTRIVASDRDEGAVSSIEENLNLSNVDANLVQVVHRDALEVMFAAVLEGNFFQAIDLDPFGSPSALLGAAVHAMANGGMLCVTCTDMRVLCGMQPEAAYMRYSAMPLRTPYSKEMAIRILINTIQTLATSLGKVAEPVLSVSIDFYIRVFVRLRLNRHAAQRTCTNTAFVYHCRGCESYSLQPMAEVSSSKGISCATGPPAAALQRGASRCCGVGPFVVGGPVWTGPIQNATAIAEIAGILERDMRHLASYSRLDGLLTLLKAELDVPFFMILSSMTKVVRCSAPKITGLRALVKMAGYNVSSSHIDPLAIKTDAPLALLWDLIRAWIKQKQIVYSRLTQAGTNIVNSEMLMIDKTRLNTTSCRNLNFNLHEGILVADDDVAEVNATNRTSTRSVRRPSPLYPKNPEKNWGPKRSVGYRGPAGKRLRTSASEIKKEILPSGMGLPEESLVAKSWDDVAVEKENDQDVEVERGLERTSYMLRRLKEEEEQE